MIEPTIVVNPADIADFDEAIRLMITTTNRTAKDAVARATYRFLVSAKAQTPTSKGKNRTLHTANDAGVERWITKSKGNILLKASRASKFYIVRRQHGKPMRMLMPNPDYIRGKGSRKKRQEAREVANKIKEKYKEKPHRGAAKNSWNKAFNDIGKNATNTMKKRSRRIRAASTARRIGTQYNPKINVKNELSYLTKIAPTLEASAMRAAGASLLKTVRDGIEKQVGKF